MSPPSSDQPSIPTIHLDDPDRSALVEQLKDTCENVGFFYLQGHGISKELISKTMKHSQELFQLPLEEKRTMVDSVLNRGFTAMEEETLNPTKQSKGDTKEGFYIANRDIPEDSPLYNPAKLTGPNQWPSKEGCPSMEDPQLWREVMNQYIKECSRVAFQLTQLLALAIGLDEHHFDQDFADPLVTLRLLHYSSEASNPSEGIYACGAHSDYGMITLLLTDENPGLQIFTKDQVWMDVPPKPEAFVVNLGDLLERWTNGRFRSTVHRVLTSSSGTEGKKAERYSIPCFYDPSFDTPVKVLYVCVSEENPPRYPPTTAGQHLLDKYKETHADFSHQEQ